MVDNAEHVPDVPQFVQWLVGVAPGVRVLVTSRAPLNLSHEVEFALQPLPVPEADAPLESIAASPSVQLLVRRASLARRDFALTAENAAALAGVCARLDGLPLALELATPWLRVLTPASLLRRLSGALAVLDGGPSDRPERQQTVRATLAWRPPRSLFAKASRDTRASGQHALPGPRRGPGSHDSHADAPYMPARTAVSPMRTRCLTRQRVSNRTNLRGSETPGRASARCLQKISWSGI